MPQLNTTPKAMSLNEILAMPNAVELKQHELSPALKAQGAIGTTYAVLSDEAKQALLKWADEQRADELERVKTKLRENNSYGPYGFWPWLIKRQKRLRND